jgi:hypothetical protein
VIRRLFAWMERMGNEAHQSQRRAAKWHQLHALVCAAAVVCFLGECVYHLGARRLHRREAERLAPRPWIA